MKGTKIEYLTHVWNFQTGCRHTLDQCPCADKCWARGMATRFGGNFTPTLHPETLLEPLSLRKPARIGVCFTGDLFGDWVDPMQPFRLSESLSAAVHMVVKSRPQHSFFFLTKAPQNYQKWGERWPDNAWLGASVCNQQMFLETVIPASAWRAKHKWLSIEPLMEDLRPHVNISGALKSAGIDWVTLGGFSRGTKNQPKAEWISEITQACRNANIPYWEKNNLKVILRRQLVQELPKAIAVAPCMLHHELPEGLK